MMTSPLDTPVRPHPIVGQQANAHKHQQSCTMPLDIPCQLESHA